jgi:hypothetical protein
LLICAFLHNLRQRVCFSDHPMSRSPISVISVNQW